MVLACTLWEISTPTMITFGSVLQPESVELWFGLALFSLRFLALEACAVEEVLERSPFADELATSAMFAMAGLADDAAADSAGEIFGTTVVEALDESMTDVLVTFVPSLCESVIILMGLTPSKLDVPKTARLAVKNDAKATKTSTKYRERSCRYISASVRGCFRRRHDWNRSDDHICICICGRQSRWKVGRSYE